MTKLRRLKIEGFRGARFLLELDFTDKNLSIAIYGDNGGGKSTITDGLEWFYSDRIEHLWKEDCKEECLRNTHFPDDKDALMSVHFSDATLNADKTLSPEFRSKCSNKSDPFKDYLEQSEKERLFLRYGDILRFVLLTKGLKRAEILNIIGYHHLVELRDTLVSACNDVEKDSRFRSVRDQITKNEASLMKSIGQTIKNEAELYVVTNTLIQPLNLGINVVDEGSFKACLEAIKTKSDKTKLEKSKNLSDFHAALENLKKEVANTKGFDDFLDVYAKLLKDKEKIKKIGLKQLLEQGQQVIADQIAGENICPLCLSEIESSLVLQGIAARIQELEEISKEVQEADDKKGSALLNLRDIKSATVDAAKVKVEDDPDFATIFDKMTALKTIMDNTIKDVDAKFQKMEIIAKDSELFDKQFNALTKEIDKLLPMIKDKIAALADTEAQKLQFEIFKKLSNARTTFMDNLRLSKELDIFEKQLETLTKIKEDFVKLQGKVLQEALDTISSDVDKFYRQINPEEGIEDIHLEVIGEEGVEFSYTFHGTETHPPLKYLSESHLHCLGTCLFLASVRLFNKKNKFFILDDVITSFDTDHRIPFLRLLQDHFKDYQVILLTHERFWYELINTEMRPQGWLFNDVSWSIEDGIQLKQSMIGIKERIDYKLKNGIMDVGNDLRKLLEHILKEVCFNLEVKMRYLPNDQNERRMIGEMLSELRSKLNKEKCDVKDALILDRLASSSLLTTRASHDSPPLQSKGDIQQIIKDIAEFESLFLCSEKNCNRLVSLEFADKAGKKVKCRCGKKELEWQFA
jgi:hypothetical protein